MKKRLNIPLLILSIFIFSFSCSTPPKLVESSQVICPEASVVEGVGMPIISLNGEWEISMDSLEWSVILVPGEPAMQGFPIEHDKPFFYRTSLPVPSDYEGANILLRFYGVYGYVRVFVNGKKIREHRGNFTPWDCNLTGVVKPGEKADLRLVITDELNDISYGSSYARHPIGGILRKVELIALPGIHPEHLYLDTDLSKDNRKGILWIRTKMNGSAEGNVLSIVLKSPEGTVVGQKSIPASSADWITENIKVSPVLPWDAEHPYLYDLELTLSQNDTRVAQWNRRVGFRTVKVDGDRLLVNGKPVKLRGTNRHEIHPTLGRSITPELDRKDAELVKQANLNYVRTSHYPTTSDFLRACDELGIYVEDEAAVCFATPGLRHAKAFFTGDTNYRSRYISQVAEMVEFHRNHPCLILWSLGNESTWGSNITDCYNYIKSVDDTRPVNWSFPRTVPKDVKSYDILSSHYPMYNDLNQVQLWEKVQMRVDDSLSDVGPILHDEWAHIPDYCRDLLRHDPNVRNFWGESIKKFWDNALLAPRSIGGAIWCMVDETFMLPDRQVGDGPWGFVDIWRRKKPEFHHTRKAHCPVRVLKMEADRPEDGESLELPVANRFDNTSLDELTVTYLAGNDRGILSMPSIQPHTEGTFQVPGRDWTGCDHVLLTFTDAFGWELDDVMITFSAPQVDPLDLPGPEGGPVNIDVNSNNITLRSDEVVVSFSRKTGFIHSIRLAGKELLAGPISPVIEFATTHVSVDDINEWVATDVKHNVIEEALHVKTQGIFSQGSVVWFDQVICSDGIEIKYRVDAGEMVVPKEAEKAVTIELGYLGFNIPLQPDFEEISWQRQALWSTYPEGHIGRPSGTASKIKKHSNIEYNQEPLWPFEEDCHDFFLLSTEQGKGYSAPIDFLATRRNIDYFLAKADDTEPGIAVVRNNHSPTHCQAQVDENGLVNLRALNLVNYEALHDTTWGNFIEPGHPLDETFEGELHLRFLLK